MTRKPSFDTDIVILACRGVPGTGSGSESKYGTDDKDPLQNLGKETRDFIKEILDRAVRDPAAAEAEADDLPQGTIATMVSASYEWRDWQAARALKDLCLAGDWEQIMGHLRVYAGRIEEVLKWTDKVPGYGQALDSAVVSQMVSFADEYNRSPNNRILGALAKRPAVQVALKASFRRLARLTPDCCLEQRPWSGPALCVVGTGVDPVTSRFSAARSTS